MPVYLIQENFAPLTPLLLVVHHNLVIHYTYSFTIYTFQVTEDEPTQEQVQKFVDDNFIQVPNDFNSQGSEFQEWNPIDWSEDIPLFDKITVIQKLGKSVP